MQYISQFHISNRLDISFIDIWVGMGYKTELLSNKIRDSHTVAFQKDHGCSDKKAFQPRELLLSL